MCRKGLKSRRFHTTNWYTWYYKNSSYFPYLQQAGMLFANTPKVKRCLSRKMTIHILLWTWRFWLCMMKRLRCRRGVIYHVPTHHEANHSTYLLIRGVIHHVPKHRKTNHSTCLLIRNVMNHAPTMSLLANGTWWITPLRCFVTCRNLPPLKMPLNYWYSSMAIPVNKQANHSPPFWGGVGGGAVTSLLTCFLPATWLPRCSFRPSRILSWRRRWSVESVR